MKFKFLIPYLIIAAAVIVAFFPGLNAHFIWDDFTYVINYDFVKMPDAISRIWLKGQLIDFWPIAWSLFVYQWRWFGQEPFGYHAFNFAVHIINCWLFLALLKKLKFRYAFWAALLFAVHPVGVDSVVWMFQSKTTVATLFGLIACFWYFNFTEYKKYGWLIASLFAFTASLLTKSTLITLPVALVIYEFACGRVQLKAPRTWPLQLAPYFLISLVLGLISVFWYPDTQLESLVDRTPVDILGHASILAFFYPYKILLPFNLSFVYYDWRPNLTWWQMYLPMLALLALIFVAWKFRANAQARWFAFCYAGYIALLVPVLGFFRIYYLRYSPASDHWQYHASMVAIPMLLVGFQWAWQKLKLKHFGWAMAFLAAAYIGLSYQHSLNYKNEETAWIDTLKKHPSSTLALNNYGILLEGQGKKLEAKALYEEVLRYHPDDVEGNTNLGAFYVNNNQPDIGIPLLLKALSRNPNSSKATYNLGVAYSQKQEFDMAIVRYLEALKLDPALTKARNNLGIAYYRKLKFAEAAAIYQSALKIEPVNGEVHFNYGNLLETLGHKAEAKKHFLESARLLPNNEIVKAKLSALKY